MLIRIWIDGFVAFARINKEISILLNSYEMIALYDYKVISGFC